MIYAGIIVIILVLWIIGAYNNLVKHRIRSEEAWSDIDVQLKRRYDLIPNLVETVKSYAKHEKEVFASVTEARSVAMKAKGPEAKGAAENMMTEALKSVFAVAEAYPELKASDNFKALQDELADTENKISAARRFYNTNVRDFNIALDSFPTNMIGKGFGFSKKELFEVEEAAREVPKVTFEEATPAKESATEPEKETEEK